MSIHTNIKKQLIIILTIISCLFITNCTSVPTDDKPLSQWTDDELLLKAKEDFDQQKYTSSYKYLFPLAKKNNEEALYALGYLYYYGLGVDKNLDMSQDLIRQSAALGYKPAIKALRVMLSAKTIFSTDNKTSNYLAENNAANDKQSKLAQSDIKNHTSKAEKNKQISKTKTQTKKQNNIAAKPVNTPQKQDNNINNINKNNIKETAFNNKPAKKLIIAANNTIIDPAKLSNKSSNKSANQTSKTSAIKESNKNKPTNTKTSKSAQSTKNLQKKLKQHSTNDIWENEFESKNDENNKSVTPDTNTVSIAKQNKIKSKKNLNPNPNWLTEQNPENYTIQITTSDNFEDIDNFINNHNLRSKVHPFAYSYKNQTWYGASYGNYENPSDAYTALLDELPDNVKLKKPWVRQFKNIESAKK